MRVVLLNTGTELLLGDVQDAHLAFIARQIFPLGLRIEEGRTVSDGSGIREALVEIFPRAKILFVTGGLGPTTDDVTREAAAELLGLKLIRDPEVMSAILERFAIRGIQFTARVERQAFVPTGAEVLPNENGTAPGLYLRANVNPRIRSPDLFLLPGPPRELQPMFRRWVMPILRSVHPPSKSLECRIYRIIGIGESLVEAAIGERISAIPDIELGYCSRPGDVDVRIIGESGVIEQADKIIRTTLGGAIYSTSEATLEEVIVELLTKRKETVALAESCTGGLLANRITNVPGASAVLLAAYVPYANQAKIDLLDVDQKLIERHGAVSESVARALAESARIRARSTYALATTGIAGPTGGSSEKPIGTVYIALASSGETMVKRFFFPSDRKTFKELAAQAGFDLLRRRLLTEL
ncbi:MAG TPA: CinA family nicotinamide mononucleotide deamidase-related protein [Candidatus Udaeobacter sp.]